MIPPKRRDAADVAEVSVDTERQVDGGWVFNITLTRGEIKSRHDVRLSWVDYEFWSHGAAAPERVVRAVVEVAVKIGWDVPMQFDASSVRRWAGVGDGRGAAMDDRIKEAVGGTGYVSGRSGGGLDEA